MTNYWDEKAECELDRIAAEQDAKRRVTSVAELKAELAQKDEELARSRSDSNAHIRELKAELQELKELLALCNRDGGHYAERHGIKRACRQAKLRIERERGECDQKDERIRELERINAEWQQQYEQKGRIAAENYQRIRELEAGARQTEKLITELHDAVARPGQHGAIEEVLRCALDAVLSLRERVRELETKVEAYKIREELEHARVAAESELKARGDRLENKLARAVERIRELEAEVSRKFELIKSYDFRLAVCGGNLARTVEALEFIRDHRPVRGQNSAHTSDLLRDRLVGCNERARSVMQALKGEGR